MAVGNWWQKVRHCLSWQAEADNRSRGARDADKQALVALPPVDWFRLEPLTEAAEQPAPLPSPTERDQIGPLGLEHWEERLLADWAGSPDRLRQLWDWVNRAHKRLELLHFPNYPGGASIAMLRDVHPQALQELDRVLDAFVGVKQLSVEQVRTRLKQHLPGLTFPKAADRADLEELIAVARNLNGWLADHGTLACGCPPLVEKVI